MYADIMVVRISSNSAIGIIRLQLYVYFRKMKA